MPRPTNKSELKILAQRNFEKLINNVDNLPESIRVKDFPQGTLNRNVRDVIAHLYHWHLMMASWYKDGMAGENPAMPAKGYTWKDTPILNKKINELYQDITLQEALELFNESHCTIMDIIERHTDDDLFEKKKYGWTGSTSLAAYLISATSSHYDWAIKLIRKCTK